MIKNKAISILSILVGLSLVLSVLFSVSFTAQVSEVSEIEMLFSPEDNCGAKILQVLGEAEESIDVAMYSDETRLEKILFH